MSKNQNVVTPVAAKVEIVEVVSLTDLEKVKLLVVKYADQYAAEKQFPEGLTDLEKAEIETNTNFAAVNIICDAIDKKEVSKIQFAWMQVINTKRSFKSLFGQTFTKAENQISLYLSKNVVKVINEEDEKNRKAEAKKQAEATFAADVQKFEIQVAVDFQLWSANLVKANLIVNEEDANLSFTKISKDALKTSFAEFIKGLPTEPKKPGATKKEGAKVSDGSTVEKKHMTDVSKLQEGVKKVVWDAIASAKKGITKEELEKIVIASFPEKSEEVNKRSVYRALYRLPEFISDGKLFAAAKVA